MAMAYVTDEQGRRHHFVVGSAGDPRKKFTVVARSDEPQTEASVRVGGEYESAEEAAEARGEAARSSMISNVRVKRTSGGKYQVVGKYKGPSRYVTEIPAESGPAEDMGPAPDASGEPASVKIEHIDSSPPPKDLGAVNQGTASMEAMQRVEERRIARLEVETAVYKRLGRPVEEKLGTLPGDVNAPAQIRTLSTILTGVGGPLSLAFGHPEIREKTLSYVSKYPGEAAMEIILGPAAFPLTVGASTVKSLKRNDVGTAIGEVATAYTFIGLTGGIIKAGKFAYGASPKIKYGIVEVPMGEGAARTVYKGLYLEYGKGARSQPLVGISEGKLRVGTPEISLEGAVFREHVPKTGLETKVLLENIGKMYPEEEVLKVRSFLGGSEITKTQKSAFIQEAFSKEVKSLSPEQFDVVMSFARQEKAVVYGSKTAEAQMPAGKMGRIAGDIDVQLLKGQAEAELSTRQLASKLAETAGPEVRISDMHKTLIETRGEGGQWHHAVDIHSIESPLSDIVSPFPPSGAPEGAFGFKFGQKPIKIEGVGVMPLSEHGLRKGASSVTFRERRVGPAAHRIKDIGDYIVTQETLIESRKAGILAPLRARGTMKAEMHLETFRELTGSQGMVSGRVELAVPEVKMPSSMGPAVSYSPSAPAGMVADISISSPVRIPSLESPGMRMPSAGISMPASPRMELSPSISVPTPAASSISLPVSAGPSRSAGLPSPMPSMEFPSMPEIKSPSVSLPSSPSPGRSPSISAPSPAEGIIDPVKDLRGPPLPGGLKLDFSGPGEISMEKLLGRGYSYKPSLAGLFFGETIKSPIKGTLSGLGVRPPVRRGRRKKGGKSGLEALLGI